MDKQLIRKEGGSPVVPALLQLELDVKVEVFEDGGCLRRIVGAGAPLSAAL